MTAAVSTRQAWLMAARPQTLPAGAAPVLVGTGLAIDAGVFEPIPAAFALVGALLLQIGTNFANDYYDAVRGADTEDREGFTRVTAGGLIDPESVKRAMYAAFGLAILIGTYLVYVGGVPILIVGLASVVAGITYTGGPLPYGYRGLGDLFVFVFFGLVAVAGTYYVQAVVGVAGKFPLWIPDGTVPAAAIVAGLPAAGLSTAILVVNNIRDRETDAASDKRTLAVLLGYRASRIEWTAMVGLAYVIPVVFWLDGHHVAVLLAILTAPLAVRIGATVWRRSDGEALNPALERTGKLLFAHSALFAAGLAAPALL
ncbi:1,4-dihydroxy-2-naphthoate polyprenyltransferase [Natronomonas salsuginis]|uniref:1,4-dihydroxy-2-naphthoate octaprenyltransferase n=1 Tax=Natronomonas salsuginis TaxID=2217661 RepID=A0A4U5JI17_9EURY|nr:1,4-dihydroxy-2-naphthoate polyprenyltransferase [Natronomonas salsuginis]TKR28146.1 1,4-dihydroxy-2-naphthoate polyprenyltransferase [Natronomonas salsuginis]